LETVFIGDSRCTSRQALARFFEAVTRAREGNPLPASLQSAGDRPEGRRRTQSEKAAGDFEAMRPRPARARKPAAGKTPPADGEARGQARRGRGSDDPPRRDPLPGQEELPFPPDVPPSAIAAGEGHQERSNT
jgi:hypothetical protein